MADDLFGEAAAVIRNIFAYAGKPGSGPEGKTCKDCRHYVRLGGYSKVFLKCGLNRATWTHGPGSDIKARTPACELFDSDAETRARRRRQADATVTPG